MGREGFIGMTAECHLVLPLGDTLNLINVMSRILHLAGSWPLLFKLTNFGWMVGYFPPHLFWHDFYYPETENDYLELLRRVLGISSSW